MIIDTATPGFTAQIYARHTQPNPDTPFSASSLDGWVHVGGALSVHSSQTLALHTDGVSYRYYLVWITQLGSHTSVALNEVALYT